MSEEEKIPGDQSTDNSLPAGEEAQQSGENPDSYTDEIKNHSTDNSLPPGQTGQHPAEENPQPQNEPELLTTNLPTGQAGPKLQTPNMEVHHPHHLTHKKKWTEYVLEFLMLFLAVFLGFVAENIREHSIEANRAKEFASLLLTDLKSDSAYVSELTAFEHLKVKHADSLLNILASDTFMNNNHRVIYHFNNVGSLIDFKPAFPVNFEQIKNSGSIRYYKNKTLVSELSFLNRHMETTSMVYESHNQFILQNLTPFAIRHLNTQQYDIWSRKVLVPNPDIFDWNKKEAIVLANQVNLVKTYDLFFINRFLKICQQKINELIVLIKNEYHLE